MGYKNGKDLLPPALLKAVQQYAEGECIYIPKISHRQRGQRRDTAQRNADIRTKRNAGCSVRQLSQEYFLSTQAIYKILRTPND